jgi:hypothetical protein
MKLCAQLKLLFVYLLLRSILYITVISVLWPALPGMAPPASGKMRAQPAAAFNVYKARIHPRFSTIIPFFSFLNTTLVVTQSRYAPVTPDLIDSYRTAPFLALPQLRAMIQLFCSKNLRSFTLGFDAFKYLRQR